MIIIKNSNCSNQINRINDDNDDKDDFESDYPSVFEEKKTEDPKFFLLLLTEPKIQKKYLDSEFIEHSDKICKVLSNSIIIFDIDKANQHYSYKIYIDDKIIINYEEFKKYFYINQKFNNGILNLLLDNYIHFIIFLETIKKKTKNININDLESLTLKIKTINENSNDLDNISCQYILNNLILYEINKKIYQDTNILSNEKYDNFDLFIEDIINIIYGDQFIIKDNPSQISNYFSNNSTRTRTRIESKNEIYNKFPKYKIFGFQKIIKTGNAEYMKELKNKNYIIGGINNKIFIYDESYKKKKEITLSNCKYGFCELENENKILLFSEKTLTLYNLKGENTKEVEIKAI